ncbi:Phosphoglycerate kinase [Galdieria sulphuraria]|nr:Phosphoglycerate kinase [Galdieria sulphuraria]
MTRLDHHSQHSSSSSHLMIIPQHKIQSMVLSWLEEDIPSFDWGAQAVGDRITSATLYIKSKGLLAGKPFFDAIFQQLDCTVHWYDGEEESAIDDGQWFDPQSQVDGRNMLAIARIQGPACQILRGERTALNVLARCSGCISGTRKTTPGFRLVEKYAMLVGGVDTHRMDLSSMVMLKDNHIWSCGSIAQAIQQVQRVAGFSLKVEVECQSFSDACQAAEKGADIVMLDNMNPIQAKQVANALRQLYPSVLIECSGGIREDNVADYFSSDIDILSLSLSQHCEVIDFSLKVENKHNSI